MGIHRVFGILFFATTSLLVGFLLHPYHARAVVSYIPLPPAAKPSSVAISNLTDQAVVVDEKADRILIIDLEASSVISTVPVGKGPRGVAIDTKINESFY